MKMIVCAHGVNFVKSGVKLERREGPRLPFHSLRSIHMLDMLLSFHKPRRVFGIFDHLLTGSDVVSNYPEIISF